MTVTAEPATAEPTAPATESGIVEIATAKPAKPATSTVISKEIAALHSAVIAARDGMAQSVWVFGAALVAMRDAGGYRDYGHKTFRQYLESGDVRVAYRTAKRAIKTYETFANVGNLVADVSASGLDVLARLIEPGDDPEAIAAIMGQARDMSVRQLEPVIQAAVAARNADPKHTLRPELPKPEPQPDAPDADPVEGLGATVVARSEAPESPGVAAPEPAAPHDPEAEREAERERWAADHERRSDAAVRAAVTRGANEAARRRQTDKAFRAAVANCSDFERATYALSGVHGPFGPGVAWRDAAAQPADERATAMAALVGRGFSKEFAVALDRMTALWRDVRDLATPDEMAAAFAAHGNWWHSVERAEADAARWAGLSDDERAEYDDDDHPQPVALPDAPAMVAWALDVVARAERLRAEAVESPEDAAADDD